MPDVSDAGTERMGEPVGCGHSCRRCADYFTCRLPGCPDCPDRKWRRAYLVLDRLYEEMVAARV
ncbi:MAG: hypothetical protein KKA32_18790 [Actinobacteria bacterium]|nr:hypothetical protein [Actinomycetota bacterium]